MKNLIKLPDQDRMSYHYFCKNCHFWFAYFNTMKSNYCPNCGLKLSFDFPLTTIKEWMDYSQQRYNELKKD